MTNVDFGTYHHSTSKESSEIRGLAAKAFSKLLPSLYPGDPNIRILDAGCGLGFLTYVAAECFPKARITGVDLFDADSLAELSMDSAMKNMKALQIDSRVSFLRHDLTKPMKLNTKFDLALSNLVFHNMGQKRFAAYETVFGALKRRGYFVLGDLFPRNKTDMDYLLDHSTLISELDQGGSGRWVYKIRVLRKK